MEQSTQHLAPRRTVRESASPLDSVSSSISDNTVEIRNIPRPAAFAPRLLVRPLVDPESTLDLTDAVTDAIAHELGRAFGGNPVLNRLEAGAHLRSLLAAATRVAHGPRAATERQEARRTAPRIPLGLPLHIDGDQHAG